MPFPSVRSFFNPLPTPATSPVRSRSTKPGDGFENYSSPSPPPLPPLNTTETRTAYYNPRDGYLETKISHLKSGPQKSCFLGRIANFRMQECNAKSSISSAAKFLIKLAIKDDTGAIELKLWLTKPLETSIKLGDPVMVHTTFITMLAPGEEQESPSTIGCFVSLSDTASDQSFEALSEEDEEGVYDRIPMGLGSKGLLGVIPFRAFMEGASDVVGGRLLVCVKWLSPRKLDITRKDGKPAQKIEVGIFDDTCEGIMTLWGPMADSALSWEASETVLLITSSRLTIWHGIPQVVLTKTSLIDVNPDCRDAQWLRDYVKTHLNNAQDPFRPFPGEDVLPWEEGLAGKYRVKYTLGELDEYTRENPKGQCVGYISVIIVKINLMDIYRKNMLLCGKCCGSQVCGNTYATAICRRCEQPLISPILNPGILGEFADETGSISGSQMLWSETAWTSFFGRSLYELVESTTVEVLRYFEERCLFMRVTLAFGWDSGVGRVCVWDVLQ